MLRIAKKLGADLVLIDTPPKLDKAIGAALAPATLALIPVRSSILDLQALEDCVRVVDFAKARSKTVVVMNAVPTGRNRDAAVKEVMRYADRHELEVMSERLSEGLRLGLRRHCSVVSSVPAPFTSMLPPSRIIPGCTTGRPSSAARRRGTASSCSKGGYLPPQAL